MPNSIVIWLRLGDIVEHARNEAVFVESAAVIAQRRVGLDGSGDEAVDHPRKAPAGRFLKIRKRQVTPQAARNRGLRTFRRRERSVRACGLGGRAAGRLSARRCVPERLGSDGLMRRNDGHAGALSRGVRDNFTFAKARMPVLRRNCNLTCRPFRALGRVCSLIDIKQLGRKK